MSSIAYFALRDDNLPGSGSITDPFNGNTDTLLDTKLFLLEPDTVIVYYPGVYRTKGFGNTATFGWAVKSRQRIQGSGMHSTICSSSRLRSRQKWRKKK